MLFKISFNNIRKSIKDYGIYFFTLVFAVAMFYMFNSLDAQSSMLVLNSSKREAINDLVVLLGYVSVFVSFILGFLIIYSNKFLIRRRKKEIGLYFTLGMSKRKVSLILILETLIIGLFSLGIGLLVGVGLSQFISLLTAKLFEVDMTSLKFVFSSAAFEKTIFYFGIIFVLVIIFNIFSLSRYKLIDLINAHRKNEQVKVRNKYVTIISFIFAVLFLGVAYYFLFNHALLNSETKTIIMIIAGSLGTFLLFFSLSGFLLKVIEKIKGIYYKNLNIFTLKQVNNKINTTVISTSVICIMLLLTIGILSCSISLASTFNNDIKSNNLSDYTVTMYNEIDDKDKSEFNEFEELVKEKELLNYTDEYVLFHRYSEDGLATGDMITKEYTSKLKKQYGSSISLDYNVSIVSESDYQALMKLQNQKYVDIKDNEYLLLANINLIVDAYKDYYENKVGITINNKKLKPATDEIIEVAIENYNTAGNDGVVVVSDYLVQNLELTTLNLIGNFTDDSNPDEMGFKLNNYLSSNLNYAFNIRTKLEMQEASVGLKTIVIFVGLYLGITFAISSATIIAIGQLSESSDNKHRYKILKQLGADNKMINKALFTQILIVFIFPLVVALVHSYFGLREINSLIVSIGNIDLTSNIILTTLFMVVVYGGYFLLTYFSSKNIIKE